MEALSTASAKVVFAFLVAVFATEAWLAATRPITAPEAVSYDRFVRPPLAATLHQPSRNSDVLYTLLAKRSVGLFRVSEFSLRLPSLLAGGFYLWALWRLRHRIWLMIPLALAPLAWGCFSTANGLGLALALTAWAIDAIPKKLHWGGIGLGLAAGADLAFAIPGVILAASIAGLLIWQKVGWWRVVEELLLPAVVTSFIVLVLPLSLAPENSAPQYELSGLQINSVKASIQAVQQECGTKPIGVSASPAVLPVLSFYRSEYRLSNWRLTEGPADYMIVLQQDGSIVVTR